MQPLLYQLQCRFALEMADDLRGLVAVCCRDDMNMIGQDRASKDSVTSFLRGYVKPLSNSSRLDSSEDHRGVLEVSFRLLAASEVALACGDRTRGIDFGRLAAVAEELPGANPRRPGAAWIIREPESVCAEDRVEGAHGYLHKNAPATTSWCPARRLTGDSSGVFTPPWPPRCVPGRARRRVPADVCGRGARWRRRCS